MGSKFVKEIIKDLDNRIDEFIKENNYSWTTQEIVKHFQIQ